MGRPKSTKPTKSKKISVRLTEADYMKIKSIYGSIQAFLDLIVKTLPLVLLFSCNSPSAPVSSEAISAAAPTAKTGTLYAVVGWFQRSVSLGYVINYSCTEDECKITGELRTYLNNTYYNGTGFITEFYIVESSLRRADGDIYQGQICNSSATCFDLRLNVATNYAAVSNGTHCMERSHVSNKTDYDAFIATFLPAYSNSGYLQIWTGMTKSLCGF